MQAVNNLHPLNYWRAMFRSATRNLTPVPRLEGGNDYERPPWRPALGAGERLAQCGDKPLATGEGWGKDPCPVRLPICATRR